MPRATRLLVATVVLIVVPACGDWNRGLPPADEAGLAEVFQPYLDPLGLEFTYGGIDDLRSGKHLALYVEPKGPTTDEEYLDRLLASAAAIIPVAFGTFRGLNSLDICQEPVPTGPGDPRRPKPRTVLVVGRDQAAKVDDWSAATLADLITATRPGRGGAVTVDDAIAELPTYVEAVAEADRRHPPSEEDKGGY